MLDLTSSQLSCARGKSVGYTCRWDMSHRIPLKSTIGIDLAVKSGLKHHSLPYTPKHSPWLLLRQHSWPVSQSLLLALIRNHHNYLPVLSGGEWYEQAKDPQ